MIDSCALCLETKEIQLSHFLPKAMYKALRKLSSESKLIIVDSDNDAYLSDNQVVRYLLCKDCEGIFLEKEKIMSRVTGEAVTVLPSRKNC